MEGIMLAKSQELEKVKLRIQEKIIKRIPEFEKPLMEFTKILFEEWGYIFVSASAKNHENSESKHQNLNDQLSQSVEIVNKTSQQMEKSDILSFSIHQKQDPNKSNFQYIERRQKQDKKSEEQKYKKYEQKKPYKSEEQKSAQMINSQLLSKIQVNHTGLKNVPKQIKQLSYDPMLVDFTGKMNQMVKEQLNEDKWPSMIQPGLELAVDIDNISMVGRDFPTDDRIEVIEQQQMKHKLQLWLQHYKWIKKVNVDVQSPIYTIDLTVLGKGMELQKNIQKLDAFIIEYESHEQYVRSIFMVREIRFCGSIKHQTIMKMIQIKWYGIEEVGFKFDEQWFNWNSAEQLKAILSSADSMSADKLTIKLQIDFLFNSYTRVISQLNLKNPFILSVVNLTLESYLNLVQIEISHPQKMVVHFKVLEKNPKEQYNYKVLDYTLEQLKQSFGQEPFELQSLIELQMDAFQMKCQQLKIQINEVLAIENNKPMSLQMIQYVYFQKYRLQQNSKKFRLEILPTKNFELLLQKFDWSEVEKVIFQERDFLSNWMKLVRNVKNLPNITIVEIASEKIDYEEITVKQLKSFANLKELRFVTKNDISKGVGFISKDIGQTLMNHQYFGSITRQLPNLKINFVNALGGVVNINQVVAKKPLNHPLINQVLDKNRIMKKQNNYDSAEQQSPYKSGGNFVQQMKSHIKGHVQQLKSQMTQNALERLPQDQRDRYMKRQAQRMNRVKPSQATRMLMQQSGLMNSFLEGGNVNQSMMNSSQGVTNSVQNSVMNSSLGNLTQQQNNYNDDNTKFLNQSMISAMSQFQKRKMERRDKR